MYLSYVDDSDTKSKLHKAQWQVMSAVLIQDQDFQMFEMLLGSNIEQIVPEEKLDEFVEFKGCELFGGYGIFQDVPAPKRFKAVEDILGLLGDGTVPVIYGAVDIQHLSSTPYGTAIPKDIAFRICADGIDWYIMDTYAKTHRNMDDLALLILDECEPQLKKTLQQTFRTLRRRVKPPDFGGAGKLYNFHDDMYFGDSKFSVGLQLADLCSYFITRHLCGDPEVKEFYEMIEPNIRYSRTMPEGQNATTITSVRRVQTIRRNDGGTTESSPQRNQEETGSGERGEAKAEGSEG